MGIASVWETPGKTRKSKRHRNLVSQPRLRPLTEVAPRFPPHTPPPCCLPSRAPQATTSVPLPAPGATIPLSSGLCQPLSTLQLPTEGGQSAAAAVEASCQPQAARRWRDCRRPTPRRGRLGDAPSVGVCLDGAVGGGGPPRGGRAGGLVTTPTPFPTAISNGMRPPPRGASAPASRPHPPFAVDFSMHRRDAGRPHAPPLARAARERTS